jgi:hypothetical protein
LSSDFNNFFSFPIIIFAANSIGQNLEVSFRGENRRPAWAKARPAPDGKAASPASGTAE